MSFFVGEALRDGEGGPELDGQRSLRRILHRPAQVDRLSGWLPLRHPPRPGPHVRGLRPRDQGMERNRARTHGKGKSQSADTHSIL